jgi:hypothetical protein
VGSGRPLSSLQAVTASRRMHAPKSDFIEPEG